MKTPEQKAYEESMNETISKSNSLTTKLIAVEKNFQNVKNSISADLHAAQTDSAPLW